MVLRSSLRVIVFLFVLWAYSCTKPVLIGSDFLEDEKTSIQYQDTFGLSFFTEKTDSVIVHSGVNVGLQLETYLIGNIEDPIFGKYSAEIYAQPILPSIATELLNSTLDSVVLNLRYDTTGTYGSITDPVTIEVYQMSENPAFNEEYYSNERFTDSGILLGSLTFVPAPEDSVTLYLPDDTVTIDPHIRIPLSVMKMRDIVAVDSIILENQDSFLTWFNGLYIKMTGASNTMLGIDLLDEVSGLTYYYDKDPSLDQAYTMIFTSGSIKTVHMEHDYTGSMVEAALTPEPENDYWYIQGMSGVTTSMKVEGLDILDNVIINQAELVVYCTFPDGDMGHLYPPIPYIVTQEQTDTALAYSADVIDALILTQGANESESFNIIFGGHLGEPDPGPPVVFQYTLKITQQIKEIYEGNKENIIYFNPFEKGDVPNRSVMFGPNHPLYAPRLRIYYTSL